MTRGFLLGRFMPPHAGHQWLIDAARTMVDQLTILLCWLPDDPIPGPLRLQWISEMAPGCRIVGHCTAVPQAPEDSPDFWSIWRRIVADVHPEPIDYVFAGAEYGLRLAQEAGGRFVPLGARIIGTDFGGLGGVSATAVRADPWGASPLLPTPVRAHFTRTIVMHGVESTGKSVLAERLARHFGTGWVPEYGRAHAETHGTVMDEADLLLIGAAQSATILAGKRLADRRLFADTDALMTAAWAQMMIGHMPERLFAYPKGDLYLLLEPDTAWVDDGTRIYGDRDTRMRFADISRNVLTRVGVAWERVGGDWDERFAKAVALVDAMPSPKVAQGFDLAQENE